MTDFTYYEKERIERAILNAKRENWPDNVDLAIGWGKIENNLILRLITVQGEKFAAADNVRQELVASKYLHNATVNWSLQKPATIGSNADLSIKFRFEGDILVVDIESKEVDEIRRVLQAAGKDTTKLSKSVSELAAENKALIEEVKRNKGMIGRLLSRLNQKEVFNLIYNLLHKE